MIPDLGRIAQKWACPNCDVYAVTFGQANRFHACRGLAGLTSPMVPAGFRGTVIAHEREDYIGTDDVQLDGNGRPVMNVTTTRDDGSNDVVVFAPTAYVRAEV